MRFAVLLSLLLAGGSVAASPIDLAFEHCILPQISGVEMDGLGLESISAAEAGSIPQDLPAYQSREFFRVPGSELVLAVGYTVGLRACRVTGFEQMGFDTLVVEIAERLQDYGVYHLEDCSDWRLESERLVVFPSASLSERNRYSSVSVIQSEAGPGLVLLVWETPNSNVGRGCGEET